MAAPTSYPSYAYNPTQPAVIVTSLAQFNALPLPGTWGTQPYASSSTPVDPGLTDTDTRLQQILIENRLQNNILAEMASISDDLLAWRQDILANDSGLST